MQTLFLLLFLFSVDHFMRSSYAAYQDNDNDTMQICNVNFIDKRKNLSDMALGNRRYDGGKGGMPIIYFITPTYPRREQIPELIRLGQTLMHVPNLHWIVADDTDICNTFLDRMLSRFGM